MNTKNCFLFFQLFLIFLVLIPISVFNITFASSKANSIDYISFPSGTTVYSPINKTYYSNFINLNLTFGAGLGVKYSLNYSIDDEHEGSIPLIAKFPDELHVVNIMTGLVNLPELSDGSHSLTINVLCSLNNYHGANPPGPPFKPTSPDSYDYIATWIHTICFTIDTSLPELPISENWVEVTTLSGSGGIGSTKTFTIEHVDWRIRWEIEPGNHSERQSFLVYVFPATGIKGSEQWFESIQHFGTEETTGVLNILNYSGSFYMDVLASIDSYTMVIEQNIVSIPEFTSWTILPLVLSGVFVVIIFRKKLVKSLD